MASQPPVGFPPPVNHDTHRRGLNALADEAGEDPGALVAAEGPVNYCVVHFFLVPEPTRLVGTQAVPRRNQHLFESRLHDSIINVGAWPLHKHVYLCPLFASSGRETARGIWAHLTAAGVVPNQQPGRPLPDDWRRGDAIYVHYPSDGGMGFAGAVVDTDGASLSNW